MGTTDHLEDGYLPGWPGRSAHMLTSGGTQLLLFTPGEDQIIKISDTRSTTLRAERRFNHLLGKGEKGGYTGNLQIYYPLFLYDVLDKAQKRVIDCLRGEQTRETQ